MLKSGVGGKKNSLLISKFVYVKCCIESFGDSFFDNPTL